MDIERLKIAEHQREARGNGGVFKSLFVALVFLVIGFAAGMFIPPKNSIIKVKTIVAKSSWGIRQVNSFTAGGWIEVAAPEQPIMINSLISERIDAILVKEGEMVKTGQVLVKLYSRDKKTRVELANAYLKKSEIKYNMMKSGFRK